MFQRNAFLSRRTQPLENLRCNVAGSFNAGHELDGPVCQQNGNAIDNGIAATAAQAEYCADFKLQRFAADRADDPAQIFGCLPAHEPILANVANPLGEPAWGRPA